VRTVAPATATTGTTAAGGGGSGSVLGPTLCGGSLATLASLCDGSLTSFASLGSDSDSAFGIGSVSLLGGGGSVCWMGASAGAGLEDDTSLASSSRRTAGNGITLPSVARSSSARASGVSRVVLTD
jgi:hypothetical protein